MVKKRETDSSLIIVAIVAISAIVVLITSVGNDGGKLGEGGRTYIDWSDPSTKKYDVSECKTDSDCRIGQICIIDGSNNDLERGGCWPPHTPKLAQ